MNYKELQLQIEQLQQQIKDLKVKLEEKTEKKPYEVEVPEDIGNYYFVSECGAINLLKDVFFSVDYEKVYLRGLAFKTKEEAEQLDKERLLIKKLKDCAKKYNGGWTPNLNNEYEKKHYIIYRVQDKIFENFHTWHYNHFFKLPYFKSEEIAEQFIDEFGEEIKEVFC